MKYTLLVFFAITVASANAQSVPERPWQTSAMPKTTPAHAALWSKKIGSEAGNANAWLAYYLKLQRDKSASPAQKQNEQQETVVAAAQHIQQSWQYNLLVFLESEKRDGAALLRALNMAEDKTQVYPYMIQYAIIRKDEVLAQKYTALLGKEKPLSSLQYEYHYNTLMSAEKGAVICAAGLGDLVPLAMLQQQYNIRKDITLQYYEGEVPAGNKIYLCLSLGKEILQKYPQAAYTGLLIKTSGGQTPEMLEKNYESFSLIKLNSGTAFTADEAALYKNYLPSFIILYKYYEAVKSNKAIALKNMILKIAGNANMEKSVNEILAH